MTHQTLLITTGNGPEECCFAAKQYLGRIVQDAARFGVEIDVAATHSKRGVKSAIILLTGKNTDQVSALWVGTLLWSCQSPFRKNHRRQNWFVGVMAVPNAESSMVALDPSKIRFDTFRAGGPGGQHQNTTDSAVRATDMVTGISAVSRTERSQHRNKAQAIAKLEALIKAVEDFGETKHRHETHELHQSLERGAPFRQFKGPKFKEVDC